MSPLYRLPEPGTTRPAELIVTACAGLYRAGTKFAMLFASVYHGVRRSQRRPKSSDSLRLTFQLSCTNTPGCQKRKKPIGSALASLYVRKFPSKASASALPVVLLLPAVLKDRLPV